MAKRRRKTSSTKKKPSAPARPVRPGPGERLTVLEVPYEARTAAKYAGAKWDAARRKWVHVGVPGSMPDMLRLFLPRPWSWEAWLNDDLNGTRPDPVPASGNITLHPHQRDAVQTILRAAEGGRPGFLLADEVGLGKTFAAIQTAHEMADVDKVLVIAPKGVLAGWRKALRDLGDGGKRWCLTTPGSLRHLVDVPKSAQQAKRTTTKNKRIADQGIPLVAWDLVIRDESHLFKTPTAQRSKLARRLRVGPPGTKPRGGNGTFVLSMSATAGANPLELSYLAEELGQVTGKPVADLEEFAGWCQNIGIGVQKGAYGALEWAGDPADLELMHDLLFGLWKNNTIPLGLRRKPTDIAGWPEVSVSVMPVELDDEGRKLYAAAWTEFRAALDLVRKGKDPSNGLAAMTRYRQKSSLVRCKATAEFVQELVASGRQVFVSVKWLESLEELCEVLEKAKVTTARAYGGQTEDEREAERLRFQTGEAQVIVGTIVEGVNLQANEPGVANAVPRATVVHDVRFSPLETHQSLGRCHRAGQDAPAYLLYAEDSVEVDIAERMLHKVGDMQTLHGDDATAVREQERRVVALASKRKDPFAQPVPAAA